MAFDGTRMTPIGGNSRAAVAPMGWAYESSEDAFEDVQGTGYFDTFNLQLLPGQFIYVSLADGKGIVTVATVDRLLKQVTIDSAALRPGTGDALTSDPLSQFAATTSAELADVMSDEMGSGQLVFSDKPLAAKPQNVIEVFTEADMGVPSGGVVQLIGGITYMAMAPNILLTLRYDIANSSIPTPTIITANRKFSNFFVDLGASDSLFFNSAPLSRTSLEIRNVGFVNGTAAPRAFIEYQSDELLDGLLQILGSDIVNYANKSSVLNNVQAILGDGTRWLESSPIVLIDSVFALSDTYIGGDFPEDTTTPEIIVSSSGDPTKLSQISVNNALVGTKAMEVHSNFVTGSTVTIHNIGKLPGTFAVAPFFHDATGTVTAVASAGGGSFIECIAAGHNLLPGDRVTHDADFSEVTYRGEFEVLEVVAGVSYTAIVAFTVTDTGTWTNFSLTQKDPRVTSTLNQKVALANSMTVSSVRSTKLFEVSGAQNTFVPIVDSLSPQAGDFVVDLEERIDTDPETGKATHDGLVDLDVDVKYSFGFVHSTGSAQDLEFAITQNESVVPSSILTFNSGVVNTLSTIGTILRLAPGDRVQLVRNNTTNSTNTDISNIRRLITAAG